MPEPQLGAIFWSDTAQNFYQEGRAGAVSRLVGIESLTAYPFPGGWLYYDQRGNPTPNPAQLIPDALLEKSGLGERTLSNVGKEVYNQDPGADAYYRSWFTYRDLAGELKLGWRNWQVGAKIDSEVEMGRIVKSVGDTLNIDETGDLGGTPKIWEMVTSTFWSIAR